MVFINAFGVILSPKSKLLLFISSHQSFTMGDLPAIIYADVGD